MSTPDPRARLVALAAEQGVSLAALSGLLGRNSAYLQQFVRKGSPRHLAEQDRQRLARFFGVAEQELGGAEPASEDKSYIAIPRLPLDASAGPGGLVANEVPVGALHFSRAWLGRANLSPAMLSSITVAGDSMAPTLADGDEILVDRTPGRWRDGIHVVRIDDLLLVKRISRTGADVVTLLSDNPAYPPREIPADQVEVIGRVVWRSGRL